MHDFLAHLNRGEVVEGGSASALLFVILQCKHSESEKIAYDYLVNYYKEAGMKKLLRSFKDCLIKQKIIYQKSIIR